MTKEAYLKFHRDCCDKMVEITKKKNHDYAGFGDNDPFANFRTVEKLGVTSVEKGFLVRMLDKISRINSFVEQGICKVEDEKIMDTLLDLANYSILMAGYIRGDDGFDTTELENKLEEIKSKEPYKEYSAISPPFFIRSVSDICTGVVGHPIFFNIDDDAHSANIEVGDGVLIYKEYLSAATKTDRMYIIIDFDGRTVKAEPVNANGKYETPPSQICVEIPAGTVLPLYKSSSIEL